MADQINFIDDNNKDVGGMDKDGNETVKIVIIEEDGTKTEKILPIEEAIKIRDAQKDGPKG